jgi:twinkle protein
MDKLEEYSYEYYPHRGIERSTFERYGVKTKITPDGRPISVGFSYPNGSVKARYLDKKSFFVIGDIANAGLFGRDKFSAGGSKYVTITEGEYDALALHQALGGQAPVVSVQSSSSAVRDCTRDLDFLQSFERVYLAFDGDAKGREAASRVAKLFDPNKVYLVRLTKRKDANEYLQAGEANELKNIWWNSRKYMPETIISSLDEFAEILSQEPKAGIPYPFPTLTEMTYGIRTGESVLITAQEGIGKTEFMHAIEYQLLQNTTWNIGAIFLEEPKKRHLQALAGIHLQKPAHLPDSGCTQSEIITALQQAVGVDDRLHIYSHFGSDDPEQLVDTIRFLVVARNCRVVLLDHISMAVSGLAGDDERRALDFLSTRLEMLVKELDFALILVSHVNDEGLTRGSRYISKVADIRIDLFRDVKGGSTLTELIVSKNRYCGRTGSAGTLDFNRQKYLLYEVKEPDNDSQRIVGGVEDDQRDDGENMGEKALQEARSHL